MFLALLVSIVVGAAVGGATVLDRRAVLTDDPRVSVLVGISGAIAGWVLFDTVLGLGDAGLDGWDVLGALAGAFFVSAFAWRGRRAATAAG